eukprot:TRINITY_DN59083_c0_g1_i1.p1 TRINITY_DN59083_c0_g1~~TRINITY_DN59083_c0_g1_i1.p1  ORF type:complete len:239 (+),score=89.97 TRINITY_DN59083_c0_g1_i1:38-718(+)
MKALRVAGRAALQRRCIHSVYGGFANQGAGAIGSALSWDSCRGSQNTHFRELRGLEHLTPAGRKLVSSIVHDTERLLAGDWTTDFSGFWQDQVQMHKSEVINLYEGGENPIGALLCGLSSFEPEEKALVLKKLSYLEAAFKAASECQAIYTVIYDQRFRMQREVWDAVEREKILAACTELCEEFAQNVPSEFKRKATKDLEWHLWNLRHWVWDAPNVKAAFKNTMN